MGVAVSRSTGDVHFVRLVGCRIALAVVGSADPHEVLGKHPEIEVVERNPKRGSARSV